MGGDLILGGRIWHGETNMAGHLGHVSVEPEGPRCLCGGRGCVERLAAGPYLAEDARASLREQPAPILLALVGGDPARVTAATLAEAGGAGDELSRALLHRAGRAVGLAVGNAANLLNVQTFVIDGGVSKAGPLLWEPLRRYAAQTAMPEVPVCILSAEHRDEAPLWGAVALGFEHLGQAAPRAAEQGAQTV